MYVYICIYVSPCKAVLAKNKKAAPSIKRSIVANILWLVGEGSKVPRFAHFFPDLCKTEAQTIAAAGLSNRKS